MTRTLDKLKPVASPIGYNRAVLVQFVCKNCRKVEWRHFKARIVLCTKCSQLPLKVRREIHHQKGTLDDFREAGA